MIEKIKELFNLLRNNKHKEAYNIINNYDLDYNVHDDNYNYIIQYIVRNNNVELLNLAIQKKIRLDILDTDGRTIIYNMIKLNYIDLLKIIAKNSSVGFNISNIRDKQGYTSVHYAVILNNLEALTILIDNGGDPYKKNNEGYNSIALSVIYKRNNIFDYFINNNFDLHFVNNANETLLQIAINNNSDIFINKLIDAKINLENNENEFGLTALHQSIIASDIEVFKKLLDKKVNVNNTDNYGNTALHHIIMEKKHNFYDVIVNYSPNYNISNINGDYPLHILINSNVNIHYDKFIHETDLNFQNNNGETCLMLLYKNNLINKYKSILETKTLNFFIQDNNGFTMKLNNDIENILVNSYYNSIKNYKKELIIDWEKWCSNDEIDKLKNLAEYVHNQPEKTCKQKIKNVIKKENRSLPKLNVMNLVLDSGVFVNNCSYVGLTIDVLFGLVMLRKSFPSIEVILEYPLTINKELEQHYKAMGHNYPYRMDFSNIEIIWSYQKLFFPTYFDNAIKHKLKGKYIVIPIGIELSSGYHANILFWDLNKHTIERFEPNGSMMPIGLNYNQQLLDKLLEQKFKQFDRNINYIKPSDFLPPIGFQALEINETPTCKRIGDPNGFCAIWCTWWIHQRMTNINKNFKLDEFVKNIMSNIKFDNVYFKTLIRNFSQKVVDIRDEILKENNIDINDFIVGNYNEDILNNIEKKILQLTK